jgi:hypothetical protein
MYSCDLIAEATGVYKCLAIVFCPFFIIPGFCVGLKQFGSGFSNVFNDYCEIFSTGIC